MKRPPKTENHVKELVRDWFNAKDAWHYAPIQNGLGAHGIHDRIGCVPIVITPQMVGKTVGLFVSIEAKRPGHRKEKHRGMSARQLDNAMAILDAGGLAACCDGAEDLNLLDIDIATLQYG